MINARIAYSIQLAIVLTLFGCSAPQPVSVDQPSKGHLQAPLSDRGSAPIPPIKSNIPYLPKPRLTESESLYSLSVIQAPIRELLFKLARDAKLELNIIDDISGRVTINLIDQPLPIIIERLNDVAGIRATLEGRTLTVRADTAYWVNYPIDYVNLDRYSSSSTLLANAVGSGSGTTAAVSLGAPSSQPQSATSLQVGSNMAILNRTQNEVWKTLTNGVMRILRSHYPELGAPIAEGQTASTQSTTNSATPSTSANATANSGSLTVEGLLNPGALPMAEQPINARPSPTGPYPEGEPVSSYVNLAKEAGFIGVYTTRKAHTEVQKYIDSLMHGARKQVMIEATVVEVELNDENQSGINWSSITGNTRTSPSPNYSDGLVAGGFLINQSAPAMTTLVSDVRFARDWDAKATLKLLQTFGSSQVLSSPKIVGINNQPTYIKVVRNFVYFTVSAQLKESTTIGGQATRVYTTTPNTVPLGIVMSVLPSVNESDQITLVIRPTISSLAGTVPDPNPDLGDIPNLVPIVREREMESVLKLNDGQVAILGGLIQDEAVGEDIGVPGLVTEPVLGYLFGQKNKQKRKTELVIFLRPTLIKHPDIETGDFASFRDTLQQNTSPKTIFQR